MTANITDVDAFTDPVVIPSDTEAANSASILLFTQSLANRTRNLKNRLDKQAATISPAAITSDQTDYAPTGGANAWLWRLTSDANRTIKGMIPGDVRLIANIGTFTISVEFDATGQTAGYQFAPSPDAPLFSTYGIPAGNTALFIYDATSAKWRVVEQDISQRGWTFAGSLNFTNANGLQARGGPVKALNTSDFSFCNSSGVDTAKSRTVMVALRNAGPAGWTNTAGGLVSTAANAPVELPLDFIPTGAVITRVRVAYDNNGAPTVAPSFTLVRKTPDKATPAIGTLSTIRADTDGTAGTLANPAQIMSTGTFTSAVVNRATEEWYVRIVGSDNASGDIILWVEVIFDDPGPRNG